MMSEMSAIRNIEQMKSNHTVSRKKVTQSSQFSSYLGETESMDAIFKKAAEKYNVPLNLLKAIGKTESNFNPTAVSKSGARGVMQLMPATAKELGVTDSFDPEQNIMGGAKYISQMLKRFDGDTKLALAAYNAGAGNVNKYGGVPPFKETQNYVVKVANYMKESLDVKIPVMNSNIQAASNIQESEFQKGLSTGTVVKEFMITDDLIQNYDDIFSYPDYLKFIDLLLKAENEKNAEEDEMDSNYLASQQITYNVPVMSLLNQNQ